MHSFYILHIAFIRNLYLDRAKGIDILLKEVVKNWGIAYIHLLS